MIASGNLATIAADMTKEGAVLLQADIERADVQTTAGQLAAGLFDSAHSVAAALKGLADAALLCTAEGTAAVSAAAHHGV
jgi:hypothetical protein